MNELLTSDLVRAARMLLRWEQADLAKATRLALSTIKRIEQQRGPIDANRATKATIQRAFEDAGIQFIENGVRLAAAASPRQTTIPPDELNGLE